MEGLHLLKDVTGFLADHSTTTKVLLDGLLAVMAAKTIGNGMAFIGALPGRLVAGVTAMRGDFASGLSTLSAPLRVTGRLVDSQLIQPIRGARTAFAVTTSSAVNNVGDLQAHVARLRVAMSGTASPTAMIGGLGLATAGAAGTVEQSAGRMRRAFGGIGTAIGNVGSALTGRGGMVGALGIAGSAFGGYEVGKSQGKGAGIVTGALGGAMAGSVLGPEGTVAGGVIGGLAGFVGGLHKSTMSLFDFGSAIDADKGKIGTNTGQALTDALGKADPTSLKLLTQAGISGAALLTLGEGRSSSAASVVPNAAAWACAASSSGPANPNSTAASSTLCTFAPTSPTASIASPATSSSSCPSCSAVPTSSARSTCTAGDPAARASAVTANTRSTAGYPSPAPRPRPAAPRSDSRTASACSPRTRTSRARPAAKPPRGRRLTIDPPAPHPATPTAAGSRRPSSASPRASSVASVRRPNRLQHQHSRVENAPRRRHYPRLRGRKMIMAAPRPSEPVQTNRSLPGGYGRENL